jgi:hypothetical protein
LNDDIIKLEEIDNLDLKINSCNVNNNIFNIKSLTKLVIYYPHNNLNVNIKSLPKLRYFMLENGLINNINIHDLPSLEYLSLPHYEYDFKVDFNISGLPAIKEFNLTYKFSYNEKMRGDIDYINVSELLIDEFSNVEKLTINNIHNMNIQGDKFIVLTLDNIINVKKLNIYGCYFIIDNQEDLDKFYKLIDNLSMNKNISIINCYYSYKGERVFMKDIY